MIYKFPSLKTQLEGRDLVINSKHKVLKTLILQSGAYYQGEWVGQNRDGYGVQIWSDGENYEEWKNNRANRRGKFWHIDGDQYEGE
ncbi:unnamed protein product [Paramecium octaurelia]|uniref:Uncharacterized protein n=1 Tax=Paramecium octaurelia TaxID=43137 RepID=A0A8S1WIJ9_PAROT|nr:unnamed protein product [Paramecium octaurelia]